MVCNNEYWFLIIKLRIKNNDYNEKPAVRLTRDVIHTIDLHKNGNKINPIKFKQEIIITELKLHKTLTKTNIIIRLDVLLKVFYLQ